MFNSVIRTGKFQVREQGGATNEQEAGDSRALHKGGPQRSAWRPGSARFQGRVGKCFRKKDAAGKHVQCNDPAVLAKAVTDWLVTYGNRGSHGTYLTRTEAERLITACDQFLSGLECPDCQTALWHAAAGDRSHLRCDCGALRWTLTRLLPLAFLAPDIVAAIIAGTQPSNLTLEALTKRIDLPADWNEQRKTLGLG